MKFGNLLHIGALLIVQFILLVFPAHPAAAVEKDDFPALPEYNSVNGVLTATIELKDQKIDFGDVSFDGATFNGSYGGPVLRVHPGDTMKLKLVNHLNKPTNFHFHGIHTSPLGKSDNVFIFIKPGETFDYEVKINEDQPPGLYWYHTHIHGLAQEQTIKGLSAALIVEGLENQFPQIKNLKARLFVLKDRSYDHSDDPVIIKKYHKYIETINGQTFVNIKMHPGETQFWRFGNQSAGNHFHFVLPGHKFRIIAIDGAALNQEIVTDKLDIGPAKRYSVLIDAGEAGTYSLLSPGVITGNGDQRQDDRVMGKVIVAGEPAKPIGQIDHFPVTEDLRKRPIDAERTIMFSEKVEGDDTSYYINDKSFDAARVDIRVPHGNTEEWTIKNSSHDTHLFHIHQMHFQVVAINGVEQPFTGHVDTIEIPEMGEVKIIVPFTAPYVLGKFVYHCHVLEHEDKGMMAIVQVYDPQNPDDEDPSQPSVMQMYHSDHDHMHQGGGT